MGATTTELRWSHEDELRRQGLITAGIAPKLFRFWRDCTTESLAAALAEYVEKMPTELAEVIDHLRIEIAYRTT